MYNNLQSRFLLKSQEGDEGKIMIPNPLKYLV